MASSEIGKLQQNIADLERRGVDLTGRLAAARERKAALNAQHQEALERLGTGDQSARKDLNKLAVALQEADQDVQAFTASVSSTAAKVTQAQDTLKRAIDSEAIAQLEAEIGRFSALDSDLQAALKIVDEKAGVLIAAVNGVGARLVERDPARYGFFTVPLVSDIKRSLVIRMQLIGSDQNTQPRPTFAESVAAEMRMLCAELKFELNGRTMQPARGEKLFKVRVAVPGLRDCDCRPGDIVALRPDDELTRDLASRGTIELMEPAATAA